MHTDIVKTFTVILILCIEECLLTEFTHDRKRIGPMNLVMAEHGCLQKFTVSENTIIRTQDSRLLGAKFLNESDVGNREDCLTLCCNTRFCDVAVFQEKSPFSCYLFDCGPPDDFVCKFTSHTYYTSAVLTINRHQLDLGLWSSQHQHEAELVDLRSPPGEVESPSKETMGETLSRSPQSPKKTTTTTTPTTTPVFVTSAPSSNTAAIKTDPPVDRKCSRFQFECHSGECLAIYNACDGIPQCRDGSDEGPNLGCPQSASDLDILSSQPLTPKLVGTYQSQANDNDWSPQPTSTRRKYGDDRGIFNHRGNILEYNRMNNEGSPDYPREDSSGYGGHGKGPEYYEYNQRASIPNRYSGSIGGRQGGEMNNDAAPSYQHDYPDYGPRDRQSQLQPVHKQQSLPIQSNLQLKQLPIEQTIPLQYQQRPELVQSQSWQGRGGSHYPSYPLDLQNSNQYEPQLNSQLMPLNNNGYNSVVPHSRVSQNLPVQPNPYLQNNPDQIQLRNFPSNQVQSIPSFQNPNGLQMSSQQEININNPVSNQGIPQAIASVTLQSVGKTSFTTKPTSSPAIISQSPSMDSKKVSSTANSNNISNTSFHAPKTLNPNTVVVAGSLPSNNSGTKFQAANQTVSLIVSHNSLQRLEVDIEELTREDETQKSQTSGAVLALSLGVCVTALLIVLVGCRIKGVKRRARRRRGMRSPLEHDADYLVNGMYL